MSTKTLKALLIAALLTSVSVSTAAAAGGASKAVQHGKPFQQIQEDLDELADQVDQYIEVTDEVLAQFVLDFEALQVRVEEVSDVADYAITPEELDAAIAEAEAELTTKIESVGDQQVYLAGEVCPAGSVLVGWYGAVSYENNYGNKEIDVTAYCRSLTISEYYSETYILKQRDSSAPTFNSYVNVSCPYSFERTGFIRTETNSSIQDIYDTKNWAGRRSNSRLLDDSFVEIEMGCGKPNLSVNVTNQ